LGAGNYKCLGNIRARSLSNLGGSARNITLSYDSQNRVSQSADSGATGTRTVGHDARGNVTTLGAMSSVYDMSDQPTIVSGAATGTGVANGNYRYDGHRKRVRSQVNGQVIYNVFDASGALVTVKEILAGPDKITDYVSGPAGSLARLVNGVPTYVHTDHLGSPRATSSTTGAVTAGAIYSPFGLAVSHTMPDDQGGFTGHIRDSATGLNYMQARYYDPVMGRFLSVDPVTFLGDGHTGMVNRFSHTLNDPVGRVDPDGKQSWRMQQAQEHRRTRSERAKKASLKPSSAPAAANDNTSGGKSALSVTPLGAVAAGVMASPDYGLGAEIDRDAQEARWTAEATEWLEENEGGGNSVVVQA
jgi:RHS repeat-associated protein